MCLDHTLLQTNAFQMFCICLLVIFSSTVTLSKKAPLRIFKCIYSFNFAENLLYLRPLCAAATVLSVLPNQPEGTLPKNKEEWWKMTTHTSLTPSHMSDVAMFLSSPAYTSNADIIQPGLSPLQPNLEDFMDIPGTLWLSVCLRIMLSQHGSRWIFPYDLASYLIHQVSTAHSVQ